MKTFKVMISLCTAWAAGIKHPRNSWRLQHTEDNLQHSLNVKQVAAHCALLCNPINIFVKAVLELKLSPADIKPCVAAQH